MSDNIFQRVGIEAEKLLELRQYKNGFVSAKRMLVLKLPPFFPCSVGEGKGRQFPVCSYIALALRTILKCEKLFKKTLSQIYIFLSKITYTSPEQLFPGTMPTLNILILLRTARRFNSQMIGPKSSLKQIGMTV